MKHEHEEFQYEQQLSLEEKQIAKYFRELPDFLDLPGEDEALFCRISKAGNREELKLSESVNLPLELRKIFLDFDSENLESLGDSDSEDSLFELATAKMDYGYLLEKFNKLSVRWAMTYSLNTRKRLNNSYLAILCEINKILNRLYDLLVVAIDKEHLKNCLCKRVLKEINVLMSMMVHLQQLDLDKLDCSNDIEELKITRESILDILFAKK